MNFTILNDKPLDEYSDKFSKSIIELENIEVEIDSEDQALIILNALPASNLPGFIES